MFRLVLTRRLHTTNRLCQQNLRLWDQLPGEGGQLKTGLQDLLGPLRATNFKNPNPRETVGYDHFDVAIGKNYIISINKIDYNKLHQKSWWRYCRFSYC